MNDNADVDMKFDFAPVSIKTDRTQHCRLWQIRALINIGLVDVLATYSHSSEQNSPFLHWSNHLNDQCNYETSVDQIHIDNTDYCHNDGAES